MKSASLGTRTLLVGLLTSLILLPARAQPSPSADTTSPDRRWARYQNAPETTAGQNAGRAALEYWATAPNPTRLQTVAENLDPASELWPDVVQALNEVHRTSKRPPAYREGYERTLTTLRQRVTDAEGWLSVMIALGDYHWTIEENREAALEAYETAYQRGGSQSLIADLKDRLRAVRPLEEGEVAPTFQVTTTDGSTINLRDFRGDPVLLYFWARWCSPCLSKLPRLSDLQSTYRDLQLLGLVTDENDRDKLTSYINNEQIDWPQAVTADWSGETRSPERLYGVEGPGPPRALGHLVLIDRQGRIVAQGKDLDAIQNALKTVAGAQRSGER